jgi:hypothetical protein
MSAGRLAFWLSVTALPCCACDAVPALKFAGGDTSADSAAIQDAAAAPEGADTSTGTLADAGCPDRPPQGASACCHTVPCSGDCDARCAECESKCPATGSVCCAGNGVNCHALGFVCK